MLASLVAGVFFPSLALEHDYGSSLLPGINWRLVGFAIHSNGIGVTAAIAVVLEVSGMVRQRPNWLVLLPALAVLVLAQSKTAWIGALVGVALVRFDAVKELMAGRASRSTSIGLVIFTCFSLVIIAAVIVVLGSSDRFSVFLDSSGFTTFTGRTRIWDITLNEFEKSPLFGYGPSLWDQQYRWEHGMMAAGQAHNQFVQILGQAGIIGGLSLLWYLYCLGRGCLAALPGTKGLSLVMFLLLVVRCFMEAPLQMNGILEEEALIHGLVFLFACRAWQTKIDTVMGKADKQLAVPLLPASH